MRYRAAVGLACLLFAVGSVRAQSLFVGPGATAEGDYLRGVGIAAYGLGSYNLNTAQANSINTDTAIRWNEYVYNSLVNENRKNAEHREFVLTRRREQYDQRRQQIRENPDGRDVSNGEALNSIMGELQGPQYHPSAFRHATVELPADVIRKIPFMVAADGAVFSMNRLSAHGKEKWTHVLLWPEFASERKAYEDALDNAIDEQVEGKPTSATIASVEQALNALYDRLNQIRQPAKETLYIEAKRCLDNTRKSVEVLKHHRVELALGALETYSGTTLEDLKIFMHDHKLQFAPASTPEEMGLYPGLYESLILQRELLKDPAFQPPVPAKKGSE